MLRRASDSVSTSNELDAFAEGTILRVFATGPEAFVAVKEDPSRDKPWFSPGLEFAYSSADLLDPENGYPVWEVVYLPAEDDRVNKTALVAQVAEKLAVLSRRYEALDHENKPLFTGETAQIPFLFEQAALELEVAAEELGSNEILRFVDTTVRRDAPPAVYAAFAAEIGTIEPETYRAQPDVDDTPSLRVEITLVREDENQDENES